MGGGCGLLSTHSVGWVKGGAKELGIQGRSITIALWQCELLPVIRENEEEEPYPERD